MRRLIRLTAPSILLIAAPALAKDKAPLTQPAVYQAVVDCTKIADPTQRLACFDQTVGALSTAASSKQVLIIDRTTTEKTKRSLFGLSLPKIRLFGDNDDEELDKIESTIASVSTSRDGSAIFVLPDGARWKQTEGRDTWAKSGQKIVIQRAALGGFFAKINGQAGVRVIRLPQPE